MKGITNSVKNNKYIIISGVPKEYQPVEYLESDGQSYIDTELIAHSNMSAEFDIMFNELPNNGCVIGVNNNNNRLYFLHYYQKPLIGYFNYAGEGVIESGVKYNIKSELYKGTQKLLIDDEIVYEANNNDYLNTHKSYYIFNMNNTNTNKTYCTKCKLYYCKIWKDKNLVRYFIPVYKVDDYTPGLYDLITNKFFVNIGNGIFNIGNNIDYVN